MHAFEWGPTDGRTVVMVHGNPTWSFLWRKVVAALAGSGLRIVAPDLVGLGLSSKPGVRAHSLAHHGAWLGALLDQLAPGPAVLAAQDWGGPIGLSAYADRARRLRGIVLGNTAVSPPAQGSKPTLFHRLARLPIASDLLFRVLGFPLGVLHTSQGDRSTIRGEVARAYRWPLARLADRAAPLALARMVPSTRAHPSVPELERVEALFVSAKVPVELVWGTRDPILGRALGRVQALRPDSIVTRTQAGHFLQEEVPDVLATAIRDVAARADWS